MYCEKSPNPLSDSAIHQRPNPLLTNHRSIQASNFQIVLCSSSRCALHRAQSIFTQSTVAASSYIPRSSISSTAALISLLSISSLQETNCLPLVTSCTKQALASPSSPPNRLPISGSRPYFVVLGYTDQRLVFLCEDLYRFTVYTPALGVQYLAKA